MSNRIPAPRALVVAAAGAAAFIFSAATVAQEAPAPVEKIEVTGSLIKRVEAETALPVEVLTREQIDRLGATNAEQILQTLTSISGAGGVVGAQGVGLQTFGQASASLRGLGAQRTLVLINGRRMAEFPGGAASANATSVDLNSIPTGAIERVEVLQDGASSIYGSEAVAGVINVILRKTYKGIEASAYVGTPTREGGGRTEKAGLVFGFGDYEADRFNFNTSVDFEHNQALYGRDRSFAQNAWDPTGVLYDVSATASGTIAGTWIPGQTAANQPKIGASYQYGSANDGLASGVAGSQCANAGSHIEMDINFAGISTLPNPNVGTCRFNPSAFVPLLPKIDRVNLVSNLGFKLNDSTKLYAELLYAHTKTDTLEQPSPYNYSFFLTDIAFKSPTLNPTHTDPTLLIFPSNYYYQNILVPYAQANPAWKLNPLIKLANGQYASAAGCAATPNDPACRPLSVSLRAFDGGGRDHSDAADSYRLSFGAQGTAFDWDYDLTASTSKTRIEEDTEDGYQLQLPLATLLNGLQGSTPTTAWNPWGSPQPGSIAQEIKNTNYNGLIIRSSIESDDVDARGSRSVYDLPGGPLSVGVGVSGRRETIDLVSGGPIQVGDVSGYGNPILPFDNGRSAYAGYVEVDAPIIKRVEFDAAIRTDKYTGTATQSSPKGTLRFQVSPQLLLRGSIGEGFRAPSLPELYTPQFVATTPTIKDPATGLKAQYPNLIGGNPDLRSEKSHQHSFGFVFEPIKDVSLGVDYFAVLISNTIGTLSPGDVLGLEAAGNPIGKKLVHRSVSGALLQIDTPDQNLGDLAASGVEVNARWRSPAWSFGRVLINLTGTYMDRYDQTLPDGTVEGSVAATTVNPTNPNTQFNNLTALSASAAAGGVIMRWKHNLDIVLEKEDWAFSVTQHWQTGYEDAPDNFGNPHFIGAFSTWDAQYSMKPTKEFKFSIGVKNLFDLNPPLTGNGFFFQTGYDPTYYDARARFVYGTINYKFK